jgi:NDP-sugar pyrophosphorylase family protein
MIYAIIAAGEGSRLLEEGVKNPKPLVEIMGEALIDRLIRIFMENDASEIIVICNDITTKVSEHLHQIERDGLGGRPVPLRFVVKSTPSSMHSFFEISKYLHDEPFCLTTVDTIFKEEEFKQYISAFKEMINDHLADGMMGVTDYIDDEKPLYVGTDDHMFIKGFFDHSSDCRYISGGIYGLTPRSVKTLNACMERGESRMRNFQRALIAEGLCLKAYPFNKVLDIDHAEDIRKANDFLSY